MPNDIKIYQTEAYPSSGDLLTWFYSHRLYLIIMSTHQSIPKPANAKKKSDILPIPAQSKPHPVIAQPKIESTRSNEEQLAQMRAKREASERLGSTLLTPESVPRTLPPLQPKLTIGQPNDQYEQEADRVARQVVDEINAPPKIQAKAPRNPMSVGERKPSPLDHLPVSRVQRYATGGEMDASPDLESSIQQARGGGQPLDNGIRERMEGAFGADFSGVRVHTDGTSDQLNQSIQAKAFTTGQDVFFRKGAYNPGSRGGQELLAHELTHVVQQSGNLVETVEHPTIKTAIPRSIISRKAKVIKFGSQWDKGPLVDSQDMTKGRNANLQIRVSVLLENNAEYNPGDAEYKQFVQDKWEIINPPHRRGIIAQQEMRDDNYSRIDDVGKLKDPALLRFQDYPGLHHSAERQDGLLATDELKAEFIAYQQIIDKSENEKIIAKLPQHKVTITGQHPRNYIGIPKNIQYEDKQRSVTLQPKLTIGQPGDQYEQEADRVARQVVDQINAPPKIQAKVPRQQMKSVGERKPSKQDHHQAQKVQPSGGTVQRTPLSHLAPLASVPKGLIQREEFAYVEGSKYYGINPSNVLGFAQQQETDQTCWANVILTAMGILGKTPVEENTIITWANEKLGKGSDEDLTWMIKNGASPNHYGEIINALHDKTGIKATQKSWANDQRAILQHVKDEKPVIIGNEGKNLHVVILLAWGYDSRQRRGVLFYDPADGKVHPATIQMFNQNQVSVGYLLSG